jgi:hypothetical protein
MVPSNDQNQKKLCNNTQILETTGFISGLFLRTFRMKFAKTNTFLSFLKDRLKLEAGEMPVPGEWLYMANTIGAITLRSNVLSLEQLGSILDKQEEMQDSDEEHKLFGQLAIGLGFLTQYEVDRLLELQQINIQLSLAGQLVLADSLDLESLLDIMREYFHIQSQNGSEQQLEEFSISTYPC